MSRKLLWCVVVLLCQLPCCGQDAAAAEEPKGAPQAARDVAATDDFEAILRRPIDIEFADTPLSDVADFFANKFDINVRLDHKGLTDAAVDPAAPVTLSIRKPISFQSALRLILDEFDLAFVIQDEVLKITSKEKADEILTTKVYAVADLLDRGPRRNYTDGLIGTIRETIQPDSWDDNGGPGSISRVASTLVIAQKRDVHEELQDLFAKLRAQLPKRAEGNSPASTPAAEEMTTVIYKLLHANGESTMDAIARAVSPEAWRQGGGVMAVVKMNYVVSTPKGNEDRSWDALVVRQKANVQDDVQEFLGELGRLHFSGMNKTMGGASGQIPQ